MAHNFLMTNSPRTATLRSSMHVCEARHVCCTSHSIWPRHWGGRMTLVQPTISCEALHLERARLGAGDSQCKHCTQPSLEMFIHAHNEVGSDGCKGRGRARKRGSDSSFTPWSRAAAAAPPRDATQCCTLVTGGWASACSRPLPGDAHAGPLVAQS